MNKLKNNKVSSAYQENLFMELFNKYLPYWPLFILIILIFICGATLLIKIMIPKYESTATLIIKDEKKGAEDSKTMEALNMMNAKKIIENEMEVLQSRTIMENVAKNLHLYAPIFKEGRLRNSSAYYLSPVSVIAFNPDSIKEIEKVNVDYKFPRGEIFLNNKFAGMLNQWILTPYGKLKFIPNKNYIPSAEKENIYFSLIKPKDVSKNISKNLTVLSINKLSSIITLNYKDEIPQQSEDILNEIILMYDKVSIDEKNSLAKSTLQFVNDRLNAVSKDLDVIEKTVQQYKAGSGTSDISMQGQMYLQNVSYNDQELGKLNMELAILNQADKSIDNTNSASSDLIPSIIGISDPHIAQLITELNNKELEYERLKKTVAENNPLLLSIKDQINKIKPGIAENIRSKKKNLEASKGNLLSTNSRYASMLSSIPQKEKELLEISRDQNVKNSIYSFLLQKKEESELSYASNLSDSRVINSAQSSKYPVSPNKLLIYLGALIAAFVSVLLFITVKEGLNKKVLYRKEIESMTAIPVIGELALHKPNLSLLIEPNKKSLFAEEFRKIRISLHFLGLDKNHKKILITSSIPGEGKSFFAANIAISIALSGKNVVLVDLDLHNPGLGKIFEKKTDTPGISDYLTGKLTSVDIIKKSEKYENLSFISSGSIHESPSELLLNGKVNKLIDELNRQYDLVIIDTAPCFLITDAFVLSELCDITLFMVRHKFTPKLLVKRLDKILEFNNLKNTSIIFNGISKRGYMENNYGYGYNYVYGGNYGVKINRKEVMKELV